MKHAKNICLNTDSYKVSMWKQYPPGTENVYSYIESRGGRYSSTVVFGLQAFIKEYLTYQVTAEQVSFADEMWTAHGEPFNREGWDYIVNHHNGRLPVRIRAVPEGTLVPVHNVLATIENLGGPKTAWLPTWLETAMLRAAWYGTTVATQSYYIKQTILDYLEKTGDISGIDFKLHDFGARGVSSMESAAIGGAAHLANFKGSDNMSGILFASNYYDMPMAGFSIPAAEHSTITAWGRAFEVDAYRNMIRQFGKPGTMFAVVSDSYDIFNACEHIWGDELKQEIINSGSTLIIRPDSGDPETVVIKCLQILGKKFGYTINSKGFKVLNTVRMIQGDGVNERSIRAILGHMMAIGWSADNIAFGMGGALLQQLDRDTQKFAMKCSAIQINSEWQDVMKDPITDSGKRSKAGRVTLYKDDSGKYYTGLVSDNPDALVDVYIEGMLFNQLTFTEVRANVLK